MRKQEYPKRKAQKTLLFVGEGPTEKAFLDYLKDLYHQRWSGISIKNKSADGGSPEDIIRKAVKWVQFESYDDGCVLLDADIPIPEPSRKKARQKGIVLYIPSPCIEGLYLKILGVFSQTNQDTQSCKTEFHRNYLSEDEATEKDNYKRIFPKELLDGNRTLPPLDALIRIFENTA